ncbi:MAG: SIS domain-containing protein [Phycisphaeraceae bacterium]|nr:SIS domain-containing protein [Phycisphaeraceae bacterium]
MTHPDPAALLTANAEASARLLARMNELAGPLAKATDVLSQCLLNGHTLLACGNGGSACDAAHLVAEIAGRYKMERPGFSAVDLTANHSLTTALVNDYPPEQLFARQVQALGHAGDVLVAFSTSGNSTNVRLALEAAPAMDIRTVAFLGHDGGACRDLADITLLVDHDTTARIQEAHLMLYHTICEALDPRLADAAGG